MKILDIYFKDDKLFILTDGFEVTSPIFIDTLYNQENKYSGEASKHSFVITDASVLGAMIVIDAKKLINFDKTAFTILIDGLLGFYYDKEVLYYRQIDLLTTNCSTCLDNAQMQTIEMLLMKLSLLDYATASKLIEDQIQWYTDIARLLCINLDSNKIVDTNTCSKCKNVCCSL